MDAERFLAAVRPVNFYDGGDHIWGAGTAFFVRYKNDAFLITAEHVLAAESADLSKLHVWLPGDNECVKFQGSWRYVSKTGDNEVKEDIVALRVSRSCKSLERIKESSIVVSQFSHQATELEQGQRIFVCGYPAEVKEYDELGISFTDVLLFRTGKYAGEVGGIHKVRCTATHHSLDGMSGSPAFVTIKNINFLVGMLVAASSDGAIMNLVGVQDIFSMVANTYKSVIASS